MKRILTCIVITIVFFTATILCGYLGVSRIRETNEALKNVPATQDIQPPAWFKGRVVSEKPHQGQTYTEEFVPFAETQNWGNNAIMYYSAKCGEKPPFRLIKLIRYIIRPNPEKPNAFQYSSEEFFCSYGESDTMTMYQIDMSSSRTGFEANTFHVVSKLSETYATNSFMVVIFCAIGCIVCGLLTIALAQTTMEEINFKRKEVVPV